MFKRQILIGIGLLVVAFLLHMVWSGRFLTLEQLQQHKFVLMQFVENRYVLSVFLYLLIFIVATVFGLPVTILLTVAAGYFFGVWPGLLYANIGATGGAVLSFLIFRYILGDFLQKRYADRLKSFNQTLNEYGHNVLLTMQFFPFTPTALINIFAGLTQISLWTFVWTTSLGILPGGLIYTLSGQYLAEIHSLRGLLSVRSFVLLVLLGIFALLPLLLKDRCPRQVFKPEK